jgi:hypothetical protein
MRRHAQSMSLEAMEERRLRDRSRTRQVLGGEEGVADMVQVANKQVHLNPHPLFDVTTKSSRTELYFSRWLDWCVQETTVVSYGLNAVYA